MSKQSVEEIKVESNQLRGTLADQLASAEEHFDESGKQLLKFHGIYQQDNRDARKERRASGGGKAYFFMVRSKLPGGKLTPEQYLVHDRLSDSHGNGTLRLTSRQGIQLHGVVKSDLKKHIQSLNNVLVSTLAACGDVERNVMCCPAPIRDNTVRESAQHLADQIAQHLCPRTRAYHDVWLNGERLTSPAPPAAGEEIEPIYGKTYLPRKFKTGIGLPEDNCIDTLSNDLALVISHRDGAIEGYNVYVGGGMGMTHGMDKTYPRLATALCFATPDELMDIVTAVVKVQRDFGDRQDRKTARLKYLIDHWGIPKFRQKVEEYRGGAVAPPIDMPIGGYDDHLGWHAQGDGKYWFGVHVHSGRVHDAGDVRLRSCLRALVETLRPSIRITPQQNILFCDLAADAKRTIEKSLADHGVPVAEALTKMTRHSMACPALPTCGLALADSERVLADFATMIHAEIAALGLQNEDIVLHTTGCPNGCARPYNSDIGIVGRQPGKYTVFLGGNILGDALSFQYQDLVPHDQIGAVLRGPLTHFKCARRQGERFGDFCRRLGREQLARFSEQVIRTETG